LRIPKGKCHQNIQLIPVRRISNGKQRNEVSLREFHTTVLKISIARSSTDFY